MKIGLIGLGKMGGNMAKKLIADDHQVTAFDLDEENLNTAEKNGVEACRSIEELVKKLPPPRNIWIMVPHGKPTDSTIKKLLHILDEDDLITDGGNSHYINSITNGNLCKEKGI